MKNFKRYLSLWFGFARNCFLRQSEYKIDFVGRAIVETVWIFSQVMFYKSAFRFIPALSNWSQTEIWFFVGTLIFADGLMMMVIHDNLNKFGQIIRLGMLDFYLLYPVSAVFLATMRFVGFTSIINLSFGVGVLAYAMKQPDFHITALGVISWIMYIPMGVAMIGMLAVIISSIAFWTTQSGPLVWFFYELYRLSFRPDNLYALWLRRILLTVFPAAFFISIPVQIALGKLGGPLWYASPFIILGFLTVVASMLWRRGVKLYEGAMS